MVPFPKIAVNLHFSYGKLHSKEKPYQLARSFSSVKKNTLLLLEDKKFKDKTLNIRNFRRTKAEAANEKNGQPNGRNRQPPL